MIQSTSELDAWYAKPDPWAYETTDDDARRIDILLGELPHREYANTLDIGCGEGFLTRRLLGQAVVGVDISINALARAQARAPKHHRYQLGSILEVADVLENVTFDLIVVTGVLYPQYIGMATSHVMRQIDRLLAPGGILCSVHIAHWCQCRFPYLMETSYSYAYREYQHRLEVYVK